MVASRHFSILAFTCRSTITGDEPIAVAVATISKMRIVRPLSALSFIHI